MERTAEVRAKNFSIAQIPKLTSTPARAGTARDGTLIEPVGKIGALYNGLLLSCHWQAEAGKQAKSLEFAGSLWPSVGRHREAQILPRVREADVANDATQELFVIGQFATLNIASHQVTKYPPKILVARK
jgi:hypothetical protein